MVLDVRPNGSADTRKGLVPVTATDTRQQCLEFAAAYPTPNVRAAVQFAEIGRITWEQAYNLFQRSLGTALVEVSA
jgi:hypothetical protein